MVVLFSEEPQTETLFEKGNVKNGKKMSRPKGPMSVASQTLNDTTYGNGHMDKPTGNVKFYESLQNRNEKLEQLQNELKSNLNAVVTQGLTWAVAYGQWLLHVFVALVPEHVKTQMADFITNHRDIFIQDQIQSVPDGVRMCTARPTWLAMSLKEATYKRDMANINVSSLDNVLMVDEENRIVHVEPNCTMGQITAELIPRGWTLAVVPELDDLTVGGLIMGFGIESSSHRYGLFQYICSAFEIVLPNGEYVRATATENPDLFTAIPWSHGTLGFLVGAEIKIVPAQPFVHLTYIPCYSLDAMVDTFTVASRSDQFDFVECLHYSKNRGVVMVGSLAQRPVVQKLFRLGLASRSEVNAIGKFWKPWFYKHVESMLDQAKTKGEYIGSEEELRDKNLRILNYLGKLLAAPHVAVPGLEEAAREVEAPHLFQELVPLRDYYHRHTRSIFWELQDIIPFGNEPWFRYLLGWATPPHISLLKLTTTESLREMYDKAHVVQDMLVPINTLRNSILKFHKELALYPLWICPMRLLNPPAERWSKVMPANVDRPACAKVEEGPNQEKLYDTTCPHLGGMVAPTPCESLYVDIGAYGVPQAAQWTGIVHKTYGRIKFDSLVAADNAGPELVEDDDDDDEEEDSEFGNELHVKVMRKIEAFVRKNHGFQALYADCFQSEKEFRQMFDHELYDRLREKYGCNGRLPDVYGKVSRKSRR